MIDESGLFAERLQPAAFDAITLTGSGADVVEFAIPETAAAIAAIRHTGSRNFIVESIADDGSTNELLVNEIGDYVGTVLFDDTDHSVAFAVDADGSWEIIVRPVTEARSWDGVSEPDPPASGPVRLLADTSSSPCPSTTAGGIPRPAYRGEIAETAQRRVCGCCRAGPRHHPSGRRSWTPNQARSRVSTAG